jgi:hypothetical protein
VSAACLSPPLPPPPPHPPTRQLSLSQSAVVFCEHWFDQFNLRSFANFVRSLYSVVVRVEASGHERRRFDSHQENSLSFMGEGGGSLAGRYVQLLCAGWGWLAGRYKRRRAGQAGRYKIFLMWGGGLSASSGTDTLESVQHHYAQETISLSNILWITRRRFYLYGFE